MKPSPALTGTAPLPKAAKNQDSGKIRLEASAICYESSVFGTWRLPVADLRVFGEFTNDNGPYADDYFLIFVGKGSTNCFEASFYAEGLEEFLTSLRAHLGADLKLELVYSTDFKSRVIWPPELAGKDLFRFRQVPRRGLWGRLKGLFSFPLIVRRMTPEVSRRNRMENTGGSVSIPG